MKPYLIMATINRISNLEIKELIDNEVKLIIIDEGDELIRKENEKILRDLDNEFYGPRDRLEWFKERFGEYYEKYL
ncbi:MAG: hypothetical protein QXF54_05585, partial [Candidatus Methanomethylicaceae archaeon]